MKKITYILISLFLSLSLLTGCSNNDKDEETVNNGTESTYTPYEYTFRDLPDPVYHEAADAFAGGELCADYRYYIE